MNDFRIMKTIYKHNIEHVDLRLINNVWNIKCITLFANFVASDTKYKSYNWWYNIFLQKFIKYLTKIYTEYKGFNYDIIHVVSNLNYNFNHIKIFFPSELHLKYLQFSNVNFKTFKSVWKQFCSKKLYFTNNIQIISSAYNLKISKLLYYNNCKLGNFKIKHNYNFNNYRKIIFLIDVCGCINSIEYNDFAWDLRYRVKELYFIFKREIININELTPSFCWCVRKNINNYAIKFIEKYFKNTYLNSTNFKSNNKYNLMITPCKSK